MIDATYATRWEHGTRYAYRWKNCRCPECLRWESRRSKLDLEAFHAASRGLDAAYKIWEDALYGSPPVVIEDETPKERRNRLARNKHRLHKAHKMFDIAAAATAGLR